MGGTLALLSNEDDLSLSPRVQQRHPQCVLEVVRITARYSIVCVSRDGGGGWWQKVRLNGSDLYFMSPSYDYDRLGTATKQWPGHVIEIDQQNNWMTYVAAIRHPVAAAAPVMDSPVFSNDARKRSQRRWLVTEQVMCVCCASASYWWNTIPCSQERTARLGSCCLLLPKKLSLSSLLFSLFFLSSFFLATECEMFQPGYIGLLPMLEEGETRERKERSSTPRRSFVGRRELMSEILPIQNNKQKKKINIGPCFIFFEKRDERPFCSTRCVGN